HIDQRFFHTVWRLVKNDRSGLVPKRLQLRSSFLLLGREKALENETIRRQTAGAQDRRYCRRPGKWNNPNAGANRFDDETITGVGDRRSAGIGKQCDALAADYPFNERLRFSPFVVLVIAGERRVNIVAAEQNLCVPRVFGGDQTDFLENPNRA